MKPVFRFAIAIAAIYCVVFLTVACPKKKVDQVREAAKASYRLPGATKDLAEAIRDAKGGIFSPAEKRNFGNILEPMAKAEIALVQLVKAAKEIYDRTGSLPADQASRIRQLFDVEIVKPFLRILELYRVLSPEASALLSAAIAAVQIFLRTIGVGFGSSLLNLLSEKSKAAALPCVRIPELKLECA